MRNMMTILNQSRSFLTRNASNILTGLSCVGVIATGVLSAKAASKAVPLLEKEKEKLPEDEELSKVAAVQTVWKCYAPAVCVGIGTIVCICGANYLNIRKQATLMNSYVLLEQTFKEYRKKLIELYGEEADQKIREEVVRGHCDYHRIGIESPDEKMLILEPISGELFEMYERELMDAEYHINRNFILKGAVCLNEFYEFLGLPSTKDGDELGWWMSDGYMWIDFEHRLSQTDDGRRCYILDSVFPPDEFYEDGYWFSNPYVGDENEWYPHTVVEIATETFPIME